MVEGIRNTPEKITSLSRDSHSYIIIISLQSTFKRKDITDKIADDPDIMAAVVNMGRPLEIRSFILKQLLMRIQTNRKPDEFGGSFQISSVDFASYFPTRNRSKEFTDRLESQSYTRRSAWSCYPEKSTKCLKVLPTKNLKSSNSWIGEVTVTPLSRK